MIIEDGIRKLQNIDVDTNAIIMLCTNAKRYSIPKAMISRANFYTSVIQNRKDNGGINAADSKLKIPILQQAVIDNMRRNQMIMAIVGSLVFCNIMSDVNMSVSNAVYDKVVCEGGKYHLQGLKNRRHKQRFDFLIQSVVTLRAIDIVFDFEPIDELTQDRNKFHQKKFEMSDILKLEKHMVAKVEDAVLVFGLLCHQYEDPIVNSITSAIKKFFFNDINQASDTPQRLSDEELNSMCMYVESNYNNSKLNKLYAATTSRSHKLTAYNGQPYILDGFYQRHFTSETMSKFKTDDEFLTYLSIELHSKMDPKPQQGEIKAG